MNRSAQRNFQRTLKNKVRSEKASQNKDSGKLSPSLLTSASSSSADVPSESGIKKPGRYSSPAQAFDPEPHHEVFLNPDGTYSAFRPSSRLDAGSLRQPGESPKPTVPANTSINSVMCPRWSPLTPLRSTNASPAHPQAHHTTTVGAVSSGEPTKKPLALISPDIKINYKAGKCLKPGDHPHVIDFSEQVQKWEELYGKNGEQEHFQAALEKACFVSCKTQPPAGFLHERSEIKRLAPIANHLQNIKQSRNYQGLNVDIERLADNKDGKKFWEKKLAKDVRRMKRPNFAMNQIEEYLDKCESELAAYNARPKHWIMRFTKDFELQVRP